jgi:hypothetical protein
METAAKSAAVFILRTEGNRGVAVGTFSMRVARVSRATAIVVVAAASSLAGQDLPAWGLGTASVRLDGGPTPFYRVVDARLLPDGSIAVADAGNARVAIYSPAGEMVR